MSKYYVYFHISLKDNKVFYIGKGKGNRLNFKFGRNPKWTYKAKKYGFKAIIYKDNLTEKEALDLEVELIKEYRKTHDLANITDGGEGTSGLIVSKETRTKMSAKRKGKLNAQHNKKLYKFINVKTNEKVECTQYDLYLKTGVNRSGISMLCSKKINSIKGWILNGTNPDLARLRIKNNFEYEYRNTKTNEYFKGTQYDFRKKYPYLEHSSISAISKGIRKSTKGWICLTVKSPKFKLNDDRKEKLKTLFSGKNHPQYKGDKIKFIRIEDNFIVEATRQEMKTIYGLSSQVSSLITGKSKSCKGWRLHS